MTGRRSSEKVNLQDVADLAGVGIATVDRVLNERGNVSVRTSKKVLDAARQLGIKRILPDSYRKLLRIEVILARPELPLIGRMNEAFRRLGSGLHRSVVIHRRILGDEMPETLARALRETVCDGVVTYCQEDDAIHAAVEALLARSVPAVTVISDLPRSVRLAYAGIDHYRAGRTAAYFMARMVRTPGPILVLCNHLGFQSHAERVHGFEDYLKEHAPALTVTEVLAGGDRLDLSEGLMRDALRRHSDTIGVYNVGAANRAVAAALRAGSARQQAIFIGHELTEHTRAMLRAGTMTLAIDQNPEQQARFAVEVLQHHFGFAGLSWLHPPYESRVPFSLYGPENVLD